MDSKGLPDFSTTVVATLANDLRNALTVIVRCLDAVRGNVPQSPQNDQSFADLENAIDSAFYISREMFAIARPHQIEPAVVDVNEVVAYARDMIERILGDNIRLSLHLAALTPVVRADVVQLEWVLLNLAWNAVDAMPNGGRLKIETVSIDIPDQVMTDAASRGRRQVRVTVNDSGFGMTAEARISALEPFFSTKQGRMGLGLTSSAMTVRRLGGSLHLRNNAPQGTSVDIYLPVVTTPPQNK